MTYRFLASDLHFDNGPDNDINDSEDNPTKSDSLMWRPTINIDERSTLDISHLAQTKSTDMETVMMPRRIMVETRKSALT